MSARIIEINRRDFLKIVFGTVATTAILGKVGVSIATDNYKMPVSEPYRLELEGEYFFDPLHDWDQVTLPTWRERLEDKYAFSSLTFNQQDEAICDALGLEDISDYSPFDREEWLSRQIDIEDLSMGDGAMIGPYWPGVQIFENLGWDKARILGVQIIEGDHPGSDFMAAQFVGDVEPLNREIAEFGMNLVID